MSILDSLYDALTIKAQTVNRDVTREIVEDWVGNAGPADKQIAFMTAALLELESGKYTAEELVELTAYLTDRENRAEPAPSEPGFPSGLAGDLLTLADSIEPDPVFADRLELQLHKTAQAGGQADYPGRLSALWQSFSIPERKTTMKRLLAFALVGIILFAIMWVSLPSLFPFSSLCLP